jgi:hypothetical protein
LLAISSRTLANDISWRSAAGGSFHSTGNWIGGVVPGASDVAIFGLSDGFLQLNYTVSFATDVTNQRLIIEDDNVVFDLNGRVYRTPQSNNLIGNVAGKTGQLTVLDGLWDDTGVGFTTVGTGMLTFSTGAQFVGGRINVGPSASGGLVIQNGA